MSAPLTDKQKKTLADLSAKDPATLTDGQKKALADLQEKQADFDAAQMDDNNTGSTDTAESAGGDVVYVFANLPNAQSFKLGDGTVITVEGMTVSNLKKPGGGFFPGGKFGVTPVDREAWGEVLRIYGQMRMFQNKLVFAADTLEEGKAKARELGGLRHGYEQVDPNSDRVKSTPAPDKE